MAWQPSQHNRFHSVRRMLEQIIGNQEAIMTQQDDLNALVTQLQGDESTLATAVAQVQTELNAALAAQAQQTTGQPLDLSGLQSAVSSLDSVASGLSAAAASAAGLVPPAAPASGGDDGTDGSTTPTDGSTDAGDSGDVTSDGGAGSTDGSGSDPTAASGTPDAQPASS